MYNIKVREAGHVFITGVRQKSEITLKGWRIAKGFVHLSSTQKERRCTHTTDPEKSQGTKITTVYVHLLPENVIIVIFPHRITSPRVTSFAHTKNPCRQQHGRSSRLKFPGFRREPAGRCQLFAALRSAARPEKACVG